MKAMLMTAFGGPEVLRLSDVPEPIPEPGDLLIEVKASAVNPVDCKTRSAPRWGNRTPPMILGFDASGVVIGVGSEVEGFNEGDEVYASPALIRDGANAQQVCVDARTTARRPATLSHAESAALPLVTLTAHESLHAHGQIQAGDTVLIQAGGGGVGHVAIQLAKAAGARILTTASSEEAVALCQSLGAETINYRETDVLEAVLELTNGKGCEVVLDLVGGEVFNASIPCLAVGGRLVTIVPGVPGDAINQLFAKNGSIHFEFMGSATMNDDHPERQGEILREVARMVEAGTLHPTVAEIYTLEELPEAHRQQESQRTAGKLSIQVS